MTRKRGCRISTPYLVIALAVISVSAASILVKLSTADPLVIAFYRLLFSVLLLAGPLTWQKPERPSRRDLGLSLISGAFLAAHFATWFFSLTLTSIASSTVLVSTHPFLVLAYGYVVRGERTTRPALAGVLIAVVGALLIGWGDFALDAKAFLGDALAFLGAVTVTGYFLIGQHVRQRVGAVVYSTTAYAAAAVMLLPLAWRWAGSLTGFDSQNWWIFAGLAVFPTIFGHTLFNWALKYVPASIISINILAEPVGASLLAWLIWRSIPGPLSLGGAVLLLLGIGIFLRYHQFPEANGG